MLLLQSACVLFQDGQIGVTCEDINACGPDGEGSSAGGEGFALDTSFQPDLGLDTGGGGFTFVPDRFTIGFRLHLFASQVQAHSQWENELVVILYRRDEWPGYPSEGMPACSLILRGEPAVWSMATSNTQAYFGLALGESSIVREGLCSDMDPSWLGALEQELLQASWSIAFGQLTLASENELTQWMQEELGEVDDELYLQSSTFYVETDWGGQAVLLAPSVAQGYAMNNAGYPDYFSLLMLHGADAPPDGFYRGLPLFSYTLSQ